MNRARLDIDRTRKPGNAAKDITGRRYGKAVALRDVGVDLAKKTRAWLFRCDCGREFEASLFGARTHAARNGLCCEICMDHRVKATRVKLRQHALRSYRRADRRRVFGNATNAEIDERMGLARGTTRRRLNRGWPPEDCVKYGNVQDCNRSGASR